MKEKVEVIEHQIQSLIVDALKLANLTVLHTSAYRQKGSSGIAKGVPDLLVAHPLIAGHWIGIEVKKPGPVRWSSPEQKALYDSGKILLAQSPETALRHVRNACVGTTWNPVARVKAVADIDRVLDPIDQGGTR